MEDQRIKYNNITVTKCIIPKYNKPKYSIGDIVQFCACISICGIIFENEKSGIIVSIDSIYVAKNDRFIYRYSVKVEDSEDLYFSFDEIDVKQIGVE